MKQKSEYIKEIEENLWNIGEDMACDILNAYYKQCLNDDMRCVDINGDNIYNLMDSKQATDAVKHYGFAEVAKVFVEKPDWILVGGIDLETKKPKLRTEAPTVVLEACLATIICTYCKDPMTYPAFFREAVAEPLSKLCAMEL